MSKNVVGIDISKNEMTVALLIKGYKNIQHSCFANNQEGFKQLEQWIKGFNCGKVKICLEATGSYGDLLVDYCYNHGIIVGVINPLQIKSFARTKLSRHKTDKVDASIIAEYGSKFEVRSYKPITEARKELRALYRCSLSIQEQITYCINQLEHRTSLPAAVIQVWEDSKASFELRLVEIENKIKAIIYHDKDLILSYNNLQSISGIGERTAISVLSELPRIEDFKNARQLAAFLGLTPKHRVSGTSVYGRSRISKMGSGILRRALFFPAISAKRFNAYLKQFAEKLESRGKAKKVIICAVMRKLVHIIFGILKHKQPFDANLLIAKN